jgi:hypothetical protein
MWNRNPFADGPDHDLFEEMDFASKDMLDMVAIAEPKGTALSQ